MKVPTMGCESLWPLVFKAGPRQFLLVGFSLVMFTTIITFPYFILSLRFGIPGIWINKIISVGHAGCGTFYFAANNNNLDRHNFLSIQRRPMSLHYINPHLKPMQK